MQVYNLYLKMKCSKAKKEDIKVEPQPLRRREVIENDGTEIKDVQDEDFVSVTIIENKKKGHKRKKKQKKSRNL